jgi:glucose/arabinose dehydrogenase
VDVSNTSVPYSIPPDNPFADGVGGRPEIYAYGLRNPWRCSVDRGNANGVGAGRIFCGDVGQGRFEEIDIIEKGGNYGWRAYEGFECFDPKLCHNLTDSVIPPIYAYPRSIGRAVIGGYIYRGSCFPKLQGKYIYADYARKNLQLFALSRNAKSGEWTSEEICFGGSNLCHSGLVGNRRGRILSLAEDAEGELYVLATTTVSATSQSGSVILLVDPNERSASPRCSLKGMYRKL